MKTLLVVPPELVPDISMNEYNESLGTSYLTASARHHGLSCDVLDARLQGLSVTQTVSAITAYGPDVIGFTASYATSLLSALKIAAGVRSSGFDGRIVVGGHPATFAWKKLLTDQEHIDAVCLGEGEQTLVAFLSAVRDGQPWSQIGGLAYRDGGKAVATAPRPLLDIDMIPLPDRDEISTGGRPVSVVVSAKSGMQPAFSLASSRGCPFNCSFCSVAAFYRLHPGPRWRGRSASGVVDEVLDLARKHNARHFAFIDDNFIGSCERGRTRAREIARLLIESGVELKLWFETRVTDVDEELFARLKCAGVERVSIGIESLNPRTLALFNKEITVEDVERALKVLKSLGIEYRPNFIMFEPNMTVEELAAMTQTIRRLRLHWVPAAPWIMFSNSLGLFGGTDLARSLQAQSRVRKSKSIWLTDEDNELLSSLGLFWEAVPQDPRYDVLQRVHRRAITELQTVAGGLSRLARKLRSVPDETIPADTRDKITAACARIDTWLKGLAAIMLNVLDEEIAATLAHTGKPEGAVPALERAFSTIDAYDRNCLGMGASAFLAELTSSVDSVDSGFGSPTTAAS